MTASPVRDESFFKQCAMRAQRINRSVYNMTASPVRDESFFKQCAMRAQRINRKETEPIWHFAKKRRNVHIHYRKETEHI